MALRTRYLEVVAADHRLASEAGAEILRLGGNAVDAAVATSFCLAVVRPYSCGLGGGGYMVIHLRRGTGAGADASTDGRSVTLDYRETAPACMTADYFPRLGIPLASKYGPHAVGIPGTILGLGAALTHWGTMTLAEVIEPARRIATDGHAIDAHYVTSVRSILATLERDPELRPRLEAWDCGFEWVWERFLFRGQPVLGLPLVQPEMAETLRLIGVLGPVAFVRQHLAPALGRRCRHISTDEVGHSVPTRCAPVEGRFNSVQVVGMGSSCSGGRVVLQTLGILDRLRPHLSGTTPGMAAWVHVIAEACKHAFADRARNFGDPRFVGPAPLWLSDPEYLDQLAARFDPQRTFGPDRYGRSANAASGPARGGGTSHFSVVDRVGNAVACTETINLEFGSLCACPELGILLNNEIDDFATEPSAPNHFGLVESPLNAPAPGKRPLSCMAPTLVLDRSGRIQMVIGGSGGPRIMTATVQVMLDMLLHAETPEQAVAKPRFHEQWQPDALWFEQGRRDPVLEAALAKVGHAIRERDIVGCVQVIAADVDGAGWLAASDPRKGGRPAGAVR